MAKFTNNKNVKIAELHGKYSEEIITYLTEPNFKELLNLPITIRTDRNYMEPLLYAVKNSELNTYGVYPYCAGSLHEDVNLAAEIIKEEPHLIEKTPISGNRQFIEEHAKTKPEIIKYMSSQLKADDKLIQKLISENNAEVMKEVAANCVIATAILNNPELSNNKQFMSIAIDKDATLLEYVSSDLKNDYTFMKEICSSNKEAINYVSEHTEDFGEEGLTAAKEVLVEGTTSKAISGFKGELEEVNAKIEEQGENVEELDLKKLEKRRKQLERHTDFIERIKEGKVDRERAIRLINSLCKNLDEDYKKELMQYIKMDDAIIEKHKESLEKNNNNTIGKKYNNNDIEERTSAVIFSGVKQETTTTKDVVKGEPCYDKSDDERT